MQKYKNAKMQTYENAYMQKYKNTKIQKCIYTKIRKYVKLSYVVGFVFCVSPFFRGHVFVCLHFSKQIAVKIQTYKNTKPVFTVKYKNTK